MKQIYSLVFVIGIGLSLFGTACKAGTTPEMSAGGSNSPANIEDSNTAELESAGLIVESTPTTEPTKAPTPTVPPGWFESMGIEESDYMYYSNLLLTTEDELSLVNITQDYGVSLVKCETCDLVAGKFIQVTHSSKNAAFMCSDFLYRYLSIEALEAGIQERIDLAASYGISQTVLPAEVSFPSDTVLFVIQGSPALIIRYGAFMVNIAQEGANELTVDENIEVLAQMAVLQIAKLQDAGY